METAFIDVRVYLSYPYIPTFDLLQALGFAYVEGLLNSTDQELAVAKSLSSLSGANETLHSAGIEKMVYEDFYAEFASLIESIIQPSSGGMKLTVDLLLNAFQNPEGKIIHIYILSILLLTLIPCSLQFCRNIFEVPYSAIISS